MSDPYELNLDDFNPDDLKKHIADMNKPSAPKPRPKPKADEDETERGADNVASPYENTMKNGDEAMDSTQSLPAQEPGGGTETLPARDAEAPTTPDSQGPRAPSSIASPSAQPAPKPASADKAQPPTYKELVAQVALLTKLLREHMKGRGKFDPTGEQTVRALNDVPAAAKEMVRRNTEMSYTLTRVKQSLHNLIAAEALPSESWDAGIMQIVHAVEKSIGENEKSF